jgi:hypothetical protein
MTTELDELEEMTSWRSNVTGIVGHTVFISPHGVGVAIDPPDSLDPRSRTATVTIKGVVIGDLDPQLMRQVQQFVQLNRAVLLDYWDYEIDTDQLRQRLQSI